MTEYRTLRDAAEILGIAPHSVRMKAKRAGWSLSRDNAGRLLVAIPADAFGVKASPSTPVKSSQISPAKSSREGLTAALASVSELRTQVEDLKQVLAAERADRADERSAWSAAIAAAGAEAAALRVELITLRRRGVLDRILNRS